MGTELEIDLQDVSKRFGRHWILRHRNDTFRSGRIYGIRGNNGSGKSTLIRLLAGQLSPSRGRIRRTLDGAVIPEDDFYRLVSWTAPYLEVAEELSVRELLAFHFRLKPPRAGLSTAAMLDRTGLTAAADRSLTDCSSGMRQRLLLATGLYAATPLLLLDEPTVTLDESAMAWFYGELAAVAAGRLVVIASNDARDLADCDEVTTLVNPA